MSARASVSRRDFLATSAAAGAALLVGVRFERDAGAQDPAKRAEPGPFDAWIRIGTDGAITLIVAKSEMGQGVFTSLPMILAEELDVDFAAIAVEQAPTDAGRYNHGTGGSASVRTGFEPLRTLARYRKAGGAVYLAQNAVHLGRGRLEVGMPVEVLERGPGLRFDPPKAPRAGDGARPTN